MKKIGLLAIILFLISSSFQNNDSNGRRFTLKGEILDQNSNKIIISYIPDSVQIHDTVTIKNGRFIFTGQIIEPTIAWIYTPGNSNRAELFLESGSMEITLKNNFNDVIVSGSKTNDEFVLLNNRREPILERLNKISQQKLNNRDSLNFVKDTNMRNIINSNYDKLVKQPKLILAEYNSTILNFILENPKSYVSVYYFVGLSRATKMSPDSMRSVFQKFDIPIQNSRYGKKITEDIILKAKNTVGNFASDFKIKDINGNIITLSQFKGESVVLLDFWASWCKPCIENFPHLKTIYNKYHSNGFEIIGVYIDDVSSNSKKESWINSVDRLGVQIWHQIPLTESNLKENYLVNAIPLKILIDQNGKVIGNWIGASEENEKSLDKTLSKLYDKK